MLRKQHGGKLTQILALAALILSVGSWFLQAAQTVKGAWITISPSFAALPERVVGQAWSQTFTASGGTAPYTWSSSGSIPGLTFDPDTATLSGTPTAVGAFSFTISAATAAPDSGIISTTNFLVQANTTTQIANISSDAPGGHLMVGQPVWVDVTVSESADGPAPTGQVVVSADDGTSCSVTIDAAGEGRCGLNFTSVGNKEITAQYQGDTYFLTSTSAAAQRIIQASTTTRIDSITTDGPGGQYMVGFPVWVNVSVNESAAGPLVPGGSVVVSASGGASCSMTIDTAGEGQCALFFTTPGSKTITAQYQGDTYYLTSTSNSSSRTLVALTVTPSLTAGRYHTCYQAANGTVRCWGAVKYIPNNAVVPLQPVQVGPLRMVSAGGYHVCGLNTDGTIACWGDNPDVISSIPAGTFLQLSSGLNHVCAVDTAYHAQCWGEMSAELAAEPTVEVKAVASGWTHACAIQRSSNRPVCWGDATGDKLAAPNVDLSSMAAGSSHTCAIRTTGALVCWGTLASSPPAGTTYAEVGSGSDYSCARTSAGLLSCWGGQTMSVDTTLAHSSVGVGALHTCALRTTGNYLSCWGDNQYEKAPRLTLSPESISPNLAQNRPFSTTFTPSGGTSPYGLAITSGSLPPGLALAGMTLSGTPSTVGNYSPTFRLTENFAASPLPLELAPVSRSYALSVQPSWTTTTIQSASPAGAMVGSPVLVSITVAKAASSVPALDGSVVVTTDDVEVSCQGEVQTTGSAQCTLYFGTAGPHSITASYQGNAFYYGSTSAAASISITPIVIEPDVSAGDAYNCTINGDGSPVCWGKNDSGQSTPLAGPFKQISAGGSTVCALRPSGKIECWGWNGYGVAAPPAAYGYAEVSVGVSHACAFNYSGSISCWGYNPASESAVAVPGLPYLHTWSAVSAGDYHTCALTNGGARCWGRSSYNRTTVPTALQAVNSVKEIDAGGYFTCAIKADDTLACWGGDGIVDSIKSPPSGTYTALDAGRFHACALRSDGAVVCWGNNSYGQVGAAGSGYGSFSAVAAGVDHTCALRSSDQSLECWGANALGQAPRLALAPASLPTLDYGIPWQGQMLASGGRTGGYVHSWQLDQAPAGLSLDSQSGQITGTPSQPGTYSFSISVRENAIDPYLKLSQAYSIRVRAPVSAAAILNPPSEAMVGVPVRISVTVSEQPVTVPVMGAHPTGQVTVTLSDGRSCLITLTSGQGSCEIYFLTEGLKSLVVDYPGDGLFLSGRQTLTDAIRIVPFSKPQTIVTGLAQTFLYGTDGRVTCLGAGCPAAPFDAVYTSFSSGSALTCGLQTDGKARCDSAGAVTVYPGPFTSLAVGRGHACALNSTGQVTCWGENASGQASPVAGSYQKIAAGADHTCALNLSGMPVCWGANGAGQSTAVGGPFVEIAAGGAHTCALDAAGWVTCWGENAAGQSTPQGGPYTQITAGGAHSCALTPSGQVECWGDNASGQAVDPLGAFIAIDAYDNHACALRAGLKLTCWGGNESGEAPQVILNPLLVTDIPALAYWEHLFDPTGGEKPYSGSLVSGLLPSGLDFRLSEAGVWLYGTPAVPDVYSFILAWESSDAIPLVREEAYSLTVTGTDLRLAIVSAPASTAGFGKVFYWDYTITNQAALDLPAAKLTIQLPDTLSGVSVIGVAGCTQTDLTITCPIGLLAHGASVTVRLEGTITAWVGEQVRVAGEVWPEGAAWPEVAEADNRAENSVTVFGYYVYLPIVLR